MPDCPGFSPPPPDPLTYTVYFTYSIGETITTVGQTFPKGGIPGISYVFAIASEYINFSYNAIGEFKTQAATNPFWDDLYSLLNAPDEFPQYILAYYDANGNPVYIENTYYYTLNPNYPPSSPSNMNYATYYTMPSNVNQVLSTSDNTGALLCYSNAQYLQSSVIPIDKESDLNLVWSYYNGTPYFILSSNPSYNAPYQTEISYTGNFLISGAGVKYNWYSSTIIRSIPDPQFLDRTLMEAMNPPNPDNHGGIQYFSSTYFYDQGSTNGVLDTTFAYLSVVLPLATESSPFSYTYKPYTFSVQVGLPPCFIKYYTNQSFPSGVYAYDTNLPADLTGYNYGILGIRLVDTSKHILQGVVWTVEYQDGSTDIFTSGSDGVAWVTNFNWHAKIASSVAFDMSSSSVAPNGIIDPSYNINTIKQNINMNQGSTSGAYASSNVIYATINVNNVFEFDIVIVPTPIDTKVGWLINSDGVTVNMLTAKLDADGSTIDLVAYCNYNIMDSTSVWHETILVSKPDFIGFHPNVGSFGYPIDSVPMINASDTAYIEDARFYPPITTNILGEGKFIRVEYPVDNTADLSLGQGIFYSLYPLNNNSWVPLLTTEPNYNYNAPYFPFSKYSQFPYDYYKQTTSSNLNISSSAIYPTSPFIQNTYENITNGISATPYKDPYATPPANNDIYVNGTFVCNDSRYGIVLQLTTSWGLFLFKPGTDTYPTVYISGDQGKTWAKLR